MSEIDPNCAVAHGAPGEQRPDRVLVAVFSSPVAAYLLRYGADAGFRTVLVEPAPEQASAQVSADVSTKGFAEIADELADGSADVVVTDHHRDELGEVLRDALASPARWVGVMGNPRHEGPHVAALAALGVPPEEVARVHRPIGLDIGSRTPPEIAISTVAGLLADRNGRSGGFAHGR
jgi:xanthine dehydrogenase accessory factor